MKPRPLALMRPTGSCAAILATSSVVTFKTFSLSCSAALIARLLSFSGNLAACGFLPSPRPQTTTTKAGAGFGLAGIQRLIHHGSPESIGGPQWSPWVTRDAAVYAAAPSRLERVLLQSQTAIL